MSAHASGPPAPRFLRLSQVQEILNVSSAQAYALVRTGDLPAIKVGGRGQWRVEATELEAWIHRVYGKTRTFIDDHPFGAAAGTPGIDHQDTPDVQPSAAAG